MVMHCYFSGPFTSRTGCSGTASGAEKYPLRASYLCAFIQARRRAGRLVRAFFFATGGIEGLPVDRLVGWSEGREGKGPSG